jgi:hypothetical protein
MFKVEERIILDNGMFYHHGTVVGGPFQSISGCFEQYVESVELEQPFYIIMWDNLKYGTGAYFEKALSKLDRKNIYCRCEECIPFREKEE